MTPASLTALGRRPLPAEIEADGRCYRLHTVYKNDFFAITSRYAGESGDVVLKVHRSAPFLGFPMQWLGRILAARERGALMQLSGVPGVPKLIGRWEATGVVHEFIPGRALTRGQHVPDDFHDRLRALIDAMHSRNMAYVDLEKCENVLLGDNGRPYLVDFQICWYLPDRWYGKLWPARVLRDWLQAGDLYHLGKLHRRTRPDQLSAAQRAVSYHKPWYVRAYTVATWPFRRLRRWVLRRWDPGRKRGERGRIDSSDMIGVT